MGRTVDELLFTGRVAQAILHTWHGFGPERTLAEAIRLVGDRIEHLWDEAPERFTVPRRGYGEDVYT